MLQTLRPPTLEFPLIMGAVHVHAAPLVVIQFRSIIGLLELKTLLPGVYTHFPCSSQLKFDSAEKSLELPSRACPRREAVHYSWARRF